MGATKGKLNQPGDDGIRRTCLGCYFDNATSYFLRRGDSDTSFILLSIHSEEAGTYESSSLLFDRSNHFPPQ